jgi:hypothetical protein
MKYIPTGRELFPISMLLTCEWKDDSRSCPVEERIDTLYE